MRITTKVKSAHEFTTEERKVIDRALLEVEKAHREPLVYTEEFMREETERLKKRYANSQK